ncbi:Crp/Fnr family transcriptional regulator [Sphingomonas aerophila]|uniref:Crp/Fnr family transcriptional regulator n=1 Tax=Sphingomonas aerophila TaxID=1344948 RepID=UPI0031B56498
MPACHLLKGEVISEADQPIAAALFIESGVASIVKPGEQYGTAIGIAGPEGFCGTPLVLGGEYWPYSTIVQADRVTGIMIEASSFRQLVAEDADLRSVLLRSIQVKMVQLAEGLISNGQQRLLPRLARWLLMYRDRVGSDQLAVTHEYIAVMVGTRRSGVTAALHELEGAGLIRSSRGLATILNADALLALAAGGYGVTEKEHARLIEPEIYV